MVEWKWGGVTIAQSCEEFDQDAWTLKIYTLLQDAGVDCDAITCPSTVTNDCGSAPAAASPKAPWLLTRPCR